MELKSITFQEGKDGAIPKTVTVEMTIEEALWAASVSGKQKGQSPHHGIYYCLVGDVFDRYWDGGVDEAQRAFPVEIPPIVYEERKQSDDR